MSTEQTADEQEEKSRGQKWRGVADSAAALRPRLSETETREAIARAFNVATFSPSGDPVIEVTQLFLTEVPELSVDRILASYLLGESLGRLPFGELFAATHPARSEERRRWLAELQFARFGADHRRTIRSRRSATP